MQIYRPNKNYICDWATKVEAERKISRTIMTSNFVYLLAQYIIFNFYYIFFVDVVYFAHSNNDFRAMEILVRLLC
jgi:hypothetical protein